MEAKIKAYQLVKPEILGRMEKVLNAMEKIQPCNYIQVSKFLNKATNCISNRMSELECAGLITKTKIKKGRSLYVIRDEMDAREKQRELLHEYTTKKEDFEKDLQNPNLSENTQILIKKRISFYTEKLKLLKKFWID